MELKSGGAKTRRLMPSISSHGSQCLFPTLSISLSMFTYIHMKEFTDKEFDTLKQRCCGHRAEKSTCLVVDSIKLLITSAMMSGAGSCLSPCLYAYILNLYTWKSLRKQGIATNLLHLAIEVAKSSGVEQIFLHVDKNNVPALHLFEENGFKVVDMDKSDLLVDENYLLSYEDFSIGNIRIKARGDFVAALHFLSSVASCYALKFMWMAIENALKI